MGGLVSINSKLSTQLSLTSCQINFTYHFLVVNSDLTSVICDLVYLCWFAFVHLIEEQMII